MAFQGVELVALMAQWNQSKRFAPHASGYFSGCFAGWLNWRNSRRVDLVLSECAVELVQVISRFRFNQLQLNRTHWNKLGAEKVCSKSLFQNKFLILNDKIVFFIGLEQTFGTFQTLSSGYLSTG